MDVPEAADIQASFEQNLFSHQDVPMLDVTLREDPKVLVSARTKPL